MNTNLATPYLTIHGAIVRRNVARLAEYGEQHGIGIRPHTKTHKSIRVGGMQMEAGALGLTMAKVGEAEVMARVCDDLLLAYPAVDKPRTSRLAQLALHKTVRVSVDSHTAAEALGAAARAAASTIGVLVEIDVGFHRTGLQTAAEALKLAQFIDSAAGLRLDGLMCYPGHLQVPVDQQEAGLQKVSDILDEVLSLWDEHGLEAAIVTGGSTPTAYQSHLVPELTEIRPGTYVYNDMNIVRGGFCTLDDCAARFICTVVSDAVPGQIVLDAGTKTLTSDRCGPAPESGHGLIMEYPDAKIVKLTEEHGQVDVTACRNRPKVGEQVTVIPNHICPCVNLQDRTWWIEPEQDAEPNPVDARGMLS